MMLICTSSNDAYTLAKINFFKNNKLNPKKLKAQTEAFNKILKYHKDKVFNFEDFYKELRPTNPDTDELFELDEFINFLEEEYDIDVDIDNDENCKYDIFAAIVVNLDINRSRKLANYKKIYIEAMNILFHSSAELIIYIKKFGMKKTNLSEFIRSFLTNHLKNYKIKCILEASWTTLKSKFN